MNTYLRYVNPIVALAILLLCIWASICTHGDKGYDIQVHSIWRGGIPTYFIAKGLFCSLTVFILGKLLESRMANDHDDQST